MRKSTGEEIAEFCLAVDMPDYHCDGAEFGQGEKLRKNSCFEALEIMPMNNKIITFTHDAKANEIETPWRIMSGK